MKKNTFKIFFIIFATFSFFVRADIIETNSYSVIEKYLSPNTLVVTDLDNTVMRLLQYLGSDEFHVWRLKVRESEGYIHGAFVEPSIFDFAFAEMFTQMKTVEVSTADYLNTLVSKKIPILVLTARPLSTLQCR